MSSGTGDPSEPFVTHAAATAGTAAGWPTPDPALRALDPRIETLEQRIDAMGARLTRIENVLRHHGWIK